MTLYTNTGEKIETCSLFDFLDCAADGERLENGEVFPFLVDCMLYGKFLHETY